MRPEDLVFVYGALRSGTTLFRLMLNSHPDIANPGEADFLFDFLGRASEDPSSWRYDRRALISNRIFRNKELALRPDIEGIDLMSDMLAQLGVRHKEKLLTLNIHRNIVMMTDLLPNAKVIHLLRDPRDVARSCVGMGWNGISYFGVNSWLKTETEWDEAASRIPSGLVLTVHFERLMEDVEGELRRVCGFLGVPFRIEMLSYHENTSYGPPNPSLANQWKRKASQVEISLLEGRCGELMRVRGYELSGNRISRPGPLRHKMLAAQNRLLRWRHNVGRFGWRLFLFSHATRTLGLKKLHSRFAKEMERKVVERLK